MRQIPGSIEAAVEIRQHPKKKHDRAYSNPERGIFAVFDGANDDRASKLGVKVMEVLSKDPGFTVEAAFAEIHEATRHKFGKKRFLRSNGTPITTATILHIGSVGKEGVAGTIGFVGDSEAYAYDLARQSLIQWKGDTAAVRGDRVDARNFVGSPNYRGPVIEDVKLPHEVVIGAFTDGVTRVLKTGMLGAHMKANADNPQQAARAIVDGLSPFIDDATALIVRPYAA